MDFADKVELLRQIPYLRSVPAGDIQALATSLRERRYQAGDVIFGRAIRPTGSASFFAVAFGLSSARRRAVNRC